MRKFFQNYQFLLPIFVSVFFLCSVHSVAAMEGYHHTKVSVPYVQKVVSFAAEKYCPDYVDFFCEDERDYELDGIVLDSSLSSVCHYEVSELLPSHVSLVVKSAQYNFLLEEETSEKTTTSQ
jgi:hypothetical protein